MPRSAAAAAAAGSPSGMELTGETAAGLSARLAGAGLVRIKVRVKLRVRVRVG